MLMSQRMNSGQFSCNVYSYVEIQASRTCLGRIREGTLNRGSVELS